MFGQHLRSAYVGALLLLALIIGGGTENGLATSFAWQILCLPLLFDQLILVSGTSSYDRPIHTLLGLAIGSMLLQLLPIQQLASGDIGMTLQALMFMAFMAILFLSVGRIPQEKRERLLAWLLFGATANVAVAITQFASNTSIGLTVLDHHVSVGLFSNQNHFSSLLCVVIPIVIYQFASVGRVLWLALVLPMIVSVQFAAGSAAGILLSLASILVSLCIVPKATWLLRATAVGLGAVIAVVVWVNPNDMLHADTQNPLDRPRIFLNTVSAISHNLPLGSGYGTFALVYPSVEADADIGRQYVNHAHNEYLELLLEGGVPAGILVLGYIALLLLRLQSVWASFMHRSTFIAIAFLLVHSLVDYPLRTVGLAATFAILNALYFSPPLVRGTNAEKSVGTPRRLSVRRAIDVSRAVR